MKEEIDSLKSEIEDFSKTHGQIDVARSMIEKHSAKNLDLENENSKQRIRLTYLTDELQTLREEVKVKASKVESITNLKNRQLKEVEDKLLESKYTIVEKDYTISKLMKNTEEIKEELFDLRTELTALLA